MRNHIAFLVFLVGLFSQTQVRLIGSIGIAEIFIFLLAPFIFLSNMRFLKHDGFNTIILLSVLTMAGCVLSSFINGTTIPFMLRGIAATYSTFAIPVVLYSLFRRDLNSIKWFVVGLAISNFITTFVFQGAYVSETYLGGQTGLAAASMLIETGGIRFWVKKFAEFLVVPVQGWYMSMPILYSMIAPLILTGWNLFTTISGRAATLVALMGVGLIMICRKNARRMERVRRHVVLIGFLGMLVALCFKVFYQYAATHGLLSDRAAAKYESQAKGGTGVLRMLMAGRVEFFSGFYANLQRPIVGYGPWAIDRNGYHEQFLRKYGSIEDYEVFAAEQQAAAREGTLGYMMIPCHSEIMAFWTWYGLPGLLFWSYVLYLIYYAFRHCLHVVPQYFGILALMMPDQIWHIFFSPYGNRVERMFFVTFLLILRAIAKGTMPLPMQYQVEIMKFWKMSR